MIFLVVFFLSFFLAFYRFFKKRFMIFLYVLWYFVYLLWWLLFLYMIYFFTFYVTYATGVGVVSCKEWVLAELTKSVSPGRALGGGPLTKGVQRCHVPLIHGARAGEQFAIGWPKHFRLTHTEERKQNH